MTQNWSKTSSFQVFEVFCSFWTVFEQLFCKQWFKKLSNDQTEHRVGVSEYIIVIS